MKNGLGHAGLSLSLSLSLSVYIYNSMYVNDTDLHIYIYIYTYFCLCIHVWYMVEAPPFRQFPRGLRRAQTWGVYDFPGVYIPTCVTGGPKGSMYNHPEADRVWLTPGLLYLYSTYMGPKVRIWESV